MASLLPVRFQMSPEREKAPSRGDKMVFGTPRQAMKESARILRLAQLDKALPSFPSVRKSKLQVLAALWTDAQNVLKDSRGASAARTKVLEGLQELGPKISAIYAPEFESDVGVGAKIMKFMKDPKSVAISPVKASLNGKKGPTLLVSYPHANPQKGMRAYVAKCCTELNDSVSDRLYETFGRGFSDEALSLGFSVPPSSRFDFARGVHESTTRQIARLTDEFAASTRKNFDALTELTKPATLNHHPNTSLMMLAERIQGQNLLDFAHTGYKTLKPEHRFKLFERLGRLAMLDLVFGNLDRMIRPDINEDGNYELDDLSETSVGNVMVSLDNEEDPATYRLHAIDNGLDDALVEDKQAKAKYIQFLQQLFSNPKCFEKLVDHIIVLFHNVITRTEDCYGEKNVAAIREDLKHHFVADLELIARPALLLGLTNMARSLKEELIPKGWGQSAQGIALKKYLGDSCPQYLRDLQERFNAFTGAYHGSQ